MTRAALAIAGLLFALVPRGHDFTVSEAQRAFRNRTGLSLVRFAAASTDLTRAGVKRSVHTLSPSPLRLATWSASTVARMVRWSPLTAAEGSEAERGSSLEPPHPAITPTVVKSANLGPRVRHFIFSRPLAPEVP